MIKRTSRPPKRKKILIIVAALLAATAIAMVVLELTDTTYIFHDRKAVSGTIPSTSNKDASGDKDKKEDTVPADDEADPPESPKEGDAPQVPAPTGAAPIAPFGNFVSNHKPNLSGNPAPSTIESVCNTTPGAKCRIEFTNAPGVVKELAAQTTDSSGATYWNWDVNKAGLTAGIWKIKAIAELNNQSVATDAVQDLEIKP